MKTVIIFSSILGVALADLRQASQPKKAFNLLQQGGTRNGAQNFAVGSGQNVDGTINTANKGRVLYMEPSIFGYGGLNNQRNNNYDNFLRSNIDNEQDNRNFNNEAGKDHLPFRTFDASAPIEYPYKGTQAANGDDDSLQNGVKAKGVPTVLTVKPGEPRLMPLRWNNPHASEVEVNLWIMSSNPPTIVPIKKPACSGEGNQNNIIEWAIPADFNNVEWSACDSTKTFKGCNAPGDCVLQVYAHSVETRQYSTAVPIVVQNQRYIGARSLAFRADPMDKQEDNTYQWPSNFDLKSMTVGKAAGDPNAQGTRSGEEKGKIEDVALCASSQREGIDPSGAPVEEVKLGPVGGVAKKLNAPTANLYICKTNEKEKAAEKLIRKVVFAIDGVAGADGNKVENYTPFEFSSTNSFGGPALKTISITITPYSGLEVTKKYLLDLRAGGRWRFRRHLKSVCAGGANVLKEPFPDPWMDLSKLKRETCMSAQDPNANYPATTIQRAALHSDVANHAYQNSNYSPYSGQQHGEISRNMQAAAVVHMTSGNRGELGKNSIPNAVKQRLNQLNNQVNQIYQNYEKVTNKIIDDLTKTGGTNGAGMTMGVQNLGNSFRSAEKGATSTKRLKTTTYVPSFATAGYNMNVIQNAIKARTRGNKAKYADVLTTNAATGKSYVKIYEATMFQMLPAFKQAEQLGITYMPSIQTVPCSVIKDQKIKQASQLSQGANRGAVACCNGAMNDQSAQSCSRTMADASNFKKRNAANNNRRDGGLSAARTFATQRYMSLYACPKECLLRTQNQGTLAKPITKTSKGTCITALNGAQGCVPLAQKTASSTDCTGCANIFNNVEPTPPSQFQSGGGKVGNDLIVGVLSAPAEEPFGMVSNSLGDPLVMDDTAICHTESKFTCPGGDADFEKAAAEGKCKEEESTKIDKMCEDGPCDSDPDSLLCLTAKKACKVDPVTGVMCMPGSENDPCKDCVVEDGANTVAIAFTSLLAAAAMM